MMAPTRAGLTDSPLVSVVIPTRNRPDMLTRALRSVLAQSVRDLEAIVVVDGVDAASVNAAKAFGDKRIRVVESGVQRGAPAARNLGFRIATGEWLGLLDDDDEWMPTKLARQLEAAAAAKKDYPIIASALIARTPLGDDTWPREGPTGEVPLSEYLMVRTGLFPGDRLIQTSTILAKRELFVQLPYTEELKRHQDWDWLLRAMVRSDTELIFVGEPLAIWYIEEDRPSISQTNDWRLSINWIRSVRRLVTDQAYSSFLLLYPGAAAAKAKAYSAFLPLLTESVRTYPVSLRLIWIYVLYWLVPVTLRRRLRRTWNGGRP